MVRGETACETLSVGEVCGWIHGERSSDDIVRIRVTKGGIRDGGRRKVGRGKGGDGERGEQKETSQ